MISSAALSNDIGGALQHGLLGSSKIAVGHIICRAKSLGLAQLLEVQAGPSGISIVAKIEVAKQIIDAFAQEVALIARCPVSLARDDGTLKVFRPSVGEFLAPDWIVESYHSDEIIRDNATAFLMRAVRSGSQLMVDSTLAETIGAIARSAKPLGFNLKVTPVGEYLSVELDCTREALGEARFGELLVRISSSCANPEQAQIVLVPSVDTALRQLELAIADLVLDRPLGIGSITIDQHRREIRLPISDPERRALLSKLLYQSCGWRVGENEALEQPSLGRILVECSPMPRSAAELAPPSNMDINQIRWAVPSWLSEGEPQILDRYVVIGCKAMPPSAYLQVLEERLSRTAIPVILILRESPTSTHKLELTELELSDLVSYSLPSDYFVRQIKVSEGDHLKISLLSLSNRAAELAELEQSLGKLLSGASITFTEGKITRKCSIGTVSVTCEQAQARLARVFRRSGPVFQDFIACVVEPDGRIRLSEIDQGRLIADFNKASSPWDGAILSVPTNVEWIEHTKRGCSVIDDPAAFAIDVAGTKFCEDAFSARELANGDIEFKAYIARVSRWVLPGGKLDADASRRLLAIYPPRGGHTLPLLPRELLMQRVGLQKDHYRPCWSITMVISKDGSVRSSRIEEAEVRVRNFLSFEDAGALLAKSSGPADLSMLRVLGQRVNRKRFPPGSRSIRAGDLVEELLTLTETATTQHFSLFNLPTPTQRISGAGRDYERLLMQYLLESTFGTIRRMPDRYLASISKQMALDEQSGSVAIRREGAQMMGEIQLLQAYLRDTRTGSIQAPRWSQQRGSIANANTEGESPDFERIGSISVRLTQPFITDFACVLDPQVVRRISSKGIEFENSDDPEEHSRTVLFGEWTEFAITGIDLVLAKLMVRPI